MFDLSYAIAWQIGRLLALADPKFCSALIAFRARAAQALLQHDIRNELAASFPAVLALPEDALDRLSPRAASDAVRDFLFEQLPGVLDQLRPLLTGRADRRRVDDRLHQLPGALPYAELAALLASGGDPVHALLRRILPGHVRGDGGELTMPTLAAERAAAARRRALAADPQVQELIAAAANTDDAADLATWFAQLFKLVPLPFSTVVVNASMLPAEALRFFYVDPELARGPV